MCPKSNPAIYDEVLRVSHIYLGPVADRFMARQIENHLRVPPSQLTRANLLELIDWIRVSMAMLTEDVDIIEEYISELNKLTQPPHTPKNGKR